VPDGKLKDKNSLFESESSKKAKNKVGRVM
jgi:hypothetical protein